MCFPEKKTWTPEREYLKIRQQMSFSVENPADAQCHEHSKTVRIIFERYERRLSRRKLTSELRTGKQILSDSPKTGNRANTKLL